MTTKKDECLELKNINYQTMLLNNKTNIDSNKISQDSDIIDIFLSKEQELDKNKTWSKLGKANKLRKVIEFANDFSIEKSLEPDEKNQLKKCLIEALDRRRLTKIKDVIYDMTTGKIKKIPNLLYLKERKRYTIKRDKKTNTLRCLAPKKTMKIKNKIKHKFEKRIKNQHKKESMSKEKSQKVKKEVVKKVKKEVVKKEVVKKVKKEVAKKEVVKKVKKEVVKKVKKEVVKKVKKEVVKKVKKEVAKKVKKEVAKKVKKEVVKKVKKEVVKKVKKEVAKKVKKIKKEVKKEVKKEEGIVKEF